MFYLILISLVWTLVALFLALLQPWLGIYASGLSQVVDFAAPITTAALILVGTGHALRRFLQTRQLIATIPLTITLFLLFTLLFFQIGTHLGAGHYTYENSPSWYDWVVFSLVHGFRAGDPADTLEAYGWQIQSIQHHSHTTSIAVLAFHLVMGLFLITFVAGLLHQLVIDKLSRALANTNNRKARTLLFRLTVAGYIAVVVFFVAISLLTFSPFASREFQYQMTFETIFILVAIFGMAMVLCCLLPSALYSLLALVRVKGNNEPFDRNCWLYTFTIFITFITFWAASVFIFRPWESQDLLLWPMDNLLRIVDVLDIMEVYHLHLHNIPRIGWESTLTLFSRLLLVFFFGEILVWVFSELSLRFGNGALLSYEALQEVHASHPNPAIRSRAGRLLDQAPPPAKFYSPGSWGLLSGAGAVGVVLLVSFLTIPTMSAHWNDAAIQLAKTAIDRKDPRAEAALVQLKKMGPNGYAAIPTIVQAIPKAPLPKKKVLIATLGHLGREAVPPLEKILLGPEEQLAVEAVWALRRIGPVTVPSFSRGLDSPFPKVESAIFAAVATLESDAAQILLDSISKENAESHMELVLKIDHYWHLRPSSNKKVGELQEARELLLAFENPNQTVSNPLPSDPLLHAYRF